jgi:hypothetical protein
LEVVTYEVQKVLDIQDPFLWGEDSLHDLSETYILLFGHPLLLKMPFLGNLIFHQVMLVFLTKMGLPKSCILRFHFIIL